jgi:glycosyltransferase involved in cell wall biosynthesis
VTAALPELPDVPAVSVMSIVYNHERYVAEAIESVLAQGWPSDRFQYVVVDDGSTDRTAEIVERYADRLTFIRQKNQGVRAAVNRACEELRGDVICGCAGDDAWPAGRLEKLVGALRANPRAGMVYSDLEVIDGDGHTVHPSFRQFAGLPIHTGRITGKLLAANFVSGGGVMLRGCLKDVFHPIPPHAAWEDWWWAWAIGSVADVEYLYEPTYRYRRHGENLSFGASGEKLAKARRHEVRFRRWTLKNVEPHQATPSELVGGLLTLYHVARGLAEELGEPLEAALPPEPGGVADRHLGDAEDALAAVDPERALFSIVRALAADPLSSDARVLLARVAPGAEAGVPPVPPALAPPTLEARSFMVIADADDLVAAPETLTSYARWFSADDDATLVIAATGWSEERLATELPALVERAGLDGHDAPDMLALSVSAAQRAALRRIAAAALENGSEPAEIRVLAEQRWSNRPVGGRDG